MRYSFLGGNLKATSEHLDEEERAGCFALFVFLVSRDCCVAFPHDATGLSAVCDCVISKSNSLTIFNKWALSVAVNLAVIVLI